MTFTCSRIGSVVFFRLDGNFSAGSDLANLDVAVTEISDTTVGGIFLDLHHVRRLDCAGIGEIVRLRNTVSAEGRAFGLVNVDARQRRMLDMIGLTPLLGGRDRFGDTTRKASQPKAFPEIIGMTRRFYSRPDGMVSDSGTEFALV